MSKKKIAEIEEKISNAETYDEYTELTCSLRKYGLIARPQSEQSWLKRREEIKGRETK
ncbi:MAG: hypothetical protein FWD49_06150 [Firmicutes bacterium]|nr:hypothetical protein [Bacillota bacterium]